MLSRYSLLLRAAFGIAIVSVASIAQGDTIADSFDDWSFDGTQGENGWSNGWYNLTADDDETYQASDFQPFINDGTGAVDFDGENHWTGNAWQLYRDTAPDTGPWTRIAQLTGHPNGLNSAAPPSVDDSIPEEHWAIRRWESNFVGQANVISELSAANTNGPGTTVHLFHNGSLVDSISNASPIAAVNGVMLNLAVGDILDLALSPEGGGNREDGSDGSNFRLTVSTDPLPPMPVLLASSASEFSDTQGQDNWFYGYYDQRLDTEEGNGVYDTDDFIEFLNDGSGFVSDDPEFGAWRDGENHWDGTMWDLLENAAPVSHGPWTQITADGAHPAANAQGDLEVHWAVRRWVSEGTGEVEIQGVLNNTSPNGDGTVGRIFVDGDEVWSEVSNGDVIDIDFKLSLVEGQIVDFVVDSDGSEIFDFEDPSTLDAIVDGNDGTVFQVTIAGILGGGLLGDFDGDQLLTAADIDLLSQAVLAGTNEARFDLNDDNLVNGADRTQWVEDINNTYFGDSNLDGEFNSTDLVVIFQGGEYEDGVAGNSTWATGDWNGDGEFDTSDLVTAFQAGGFEIGPRGAVSSVPEPSGLVLLGTAILFVRRRRR